MSMSSRRSELSLWIIWRGRFATARRQASGSGSQGTGLTAVAFEFLVLDVNSKCVKIGCCPCVEIKRAVKQVSVSVIAR